MTDEQIEKALKYCGQDIPDCENCDYGTNSESGRRCFYIASDALDYINRLKEEKYQLEQNLGQCENGYKLELHTARCDLHFAERDKNDIAIDLLHTFEIQMHNKFGIEDDKIKPLIREIKQAVKEKYKLEI